MNRFALPGCLLALSLSYAGWMHKDPDAVAALLVFAGPPLLLAALAARRWRHAGYSASVLALGWLSHGVMRAWTDHPDSLPAWCVLLLALAIITVASGPAARARLQHRRQQRSQ